MENQFRNRSPENRHGAGASHSEFGMSLMIDAGIERALDYDRDIDETTARIIAMALSPGITSNLALFAETGSNGAHTNNRTLRSEYLPIYYDPDVPAETRRLIDWLGAFLIQRETPGTASKRLERPPSLGDILWPTTLTINGAEQPVQIRADTIPADEEEITARIALLIEKYGDALLAYLTLPDVDASRADLETGFQSAFLGTYDSTDQALHELFELRDLEEAIARFEQDYGPFITLDRDALRETLNDVYDVVELDNRLHLFTK